MALGLAAVGILGRPRSFLPDAAGAVRSVPPCRLEGREHIPGSGPFLLVLNHLNSPRIGIWWPALALSLALPEPPHWIMTSAWTYADWLRHHTLEPLSAWVFARLARVYGFTTMPPMPPRAHEGFARAVAIRKVFSYVRTHPAAIVGLAPEGHNSPGYCLGSPPKGSGRFMLGLTDRLGQVLPAGIRIEHERVVIRFGPPFLLELPASTAPGQIDRLAARQVMEKIARLLPPEMRGEFNNL